MADISAFKNYKPGDPTCRLYIKNLAKHVEEKVNDGLHRTNNVYNSARCSCLGKRLFYFDSWCARFEN